MLSNSHSGRRRGHGSSNTIHRGMMHMLFAIGPVHGAEFFTRQRGPGHYRVNDR
jgi:hypothetical protein